MARKSMADSPFQFPPSPSSQSHSHQADDHMALMSSHVSYGGGGATHGWETYQFDLTRAPDTVHSRSTSAHVQSMDFDAPEHNNLYDRRNSLPSYDPQPTPRLQPTPGHHAGSQMLQEPSLMTNQYQTQSMTPGTLSPTSPGGSIPDQYPEFSGSGYLSHTSLYTPQQSQHQCAQPDPHFQMYTTSSPYVDRGSSTNIGYNVDRGAADRTPRPTLRTHSPYQPWRRQDTAGRMESPRPTVGFSPVSSGSGAGVEDWSPQISPGIDWDPNYNHTDALSGGSSERDKQRKESQKIKKRDDRKRESDQFKRVKELLGSTGETKTEILERVIKHFGGKIPARPPKIPTVKVQNERAKRVADNRKDLTQLFDVVAQLLGYGTGAAPKRELLLEEVVNKIEKQRQPYGPRGGGGTSGYRRMAQ